MITSLSTAKPYRRISSLLFGGFLIALALSLLLLTAPDAFCASATLSWDAPTTNTDGSPLTDLAGYKIYYGTSSGAYSQTVDVGSTTSYAVAGLLDGTYYFAVTAYDTAGNESSYSNEVSRSLATQYTLTVSKTGTGTGTVTGSGISCGSTCSGTYSSGTVVTLSASAASGSQFAGWSGGGCSGTGQCVTTMTASKSVTASFTSSSSTSYTITASAGTGGSISPSGSVSVSSGASKSFTITPSSGYQITDVKVDGASVGAVSSYTFTNVTANRTISAAFSAVPVSSYTITASAGTGGSISPSGSVSVSSGASKSFTITPSSGYQITDVKVDGASVGAVSSYTFTNVTANRTISAAFSAIASTVTVYEDAEDGTTKGWDIYDSDPSGATIKNVYDTGRASRVIKLSGTGTSNGYRLRNSDSSSWGNTGQFVAEWSMKYSEEYTIYFDVETSAGHRYITYKPSLPSNPSTTGEYVYYSLGSSSKDGKWHTYIRDLKADLSAAQSGVTIQKVNGFLIRGSGKVDDIKLKSK